MKLEMYCTIFFVAILLESLISMATIPLRFFLAKGKIICIEPCGKYSMKSTRSSNIEDCFIYTYQYEHNGERKEYTGEITSDRRELNDMVHLYIRKKTGKIELGLFRYEILKSIGCSVIIIIFLVAYLCS